MKPNWPHAPAHWTAESGSYMITAGTFEKQHLFNTPEKRDWFLQSLIITAEEYGWTLDAWAVLSNHYHLIARSPGNPGSLSKWIKKLHGSSPYALNKIDHTPGRKVWFQYWDTHLTHQTAYFARLAYVHRNPARHGVVLDSRDYRWCSAAWFATNADTVFVRTVNALPIDAVNVPDDF